MGGKRNKEAIITIVGFLGAGKTTLLKHLARVYPQQGLSPYVILNDYENAQLDARQFTEQISANTIRALSGSCICCSGLQSLRDTVNQIPQRDNGITLIEANGTTDACSLAGFLGIGLDDRFLPPVQVSVVNINSWQRREKHNELEASQVQLSSLIILSHLDKAPVERQNEVMEHLRKLNPDAKIIPMAELDAGLLTRLHPSENEAKRIDHEKSHWSSCSIDLPEMPNEESIRLLCRKIPESILRVKGCVRLTGSATYTYFERTPEGDLSIRKFEGNPNMGAKLLTVGLGSDKSFLMDLVKEYV
ncbi:hypothetical protein FUAX_45530 (plasmid) [Fulvitalea axinellae]|uniref:CobW/HypB/UreG nucleotide-binding domain-containing protein n=1 Tax=Fulvitalea axinellae TaxID=1182444 RepID=A0AAU9CSN9_9BACT|nr:hypothetical protein FUAX_45530 [Fulvitalea axinellae]